MQIEYRKQIEAGHLKRIIDLLEPVVGRERPDATATGLQVDP